MINEVAISRVANGFIVLVVTGNGETKEYVATSVKDSYSFGSVSLTKVLDELFNPEEKEPSNIKFTNIA